MVENLQGKDGSHKFVRLSSNFPFNHRLLGLPRRGIGFRQSRMEHELCLYVRL
jgi:hypothetical protein